jgi:eukaryotic-like serine/threonine-protein kinase
MLTAGTKLDGYEVLGPLGAGGMGEVYRARDSVLRREVAIKVLPSVFSQDPDRLRRFEQEARAAAALNHPNILAVHQLGTFESAPYLVSELLEGGTLREQLVRGPLPVRKAIDYGVQIARGLAAAHEKGIAHRDLKPENLYVTKDGRIKILDFGLARLAQRELPSDDSGPTLTNGTEPGVVLGTVGYMAPEQVRGKTADHRADIFAFGAILYEMLAGKRAFQKPTSTETMTAILNEDVRGISQIVPGIPPVLPRVVDRCLEKNPEQRFQSASDLAFALEALSESSPLSISAAAPQPRSLANWIWIAIGGIAVVLAAGSIALWKRPPEVPLIEEVTQLTDDGEAKDYSRLVTDGSRVYFNEGQSGSRRIAQVSVKGGQTAPVNTNLRSPEVVDLSRDGATLLVFEGGVNSNYSFNFPWLIPLPAGEPRRLRDLEVQDARLLPNGGIVFSDARGLQVLEKNGATARKLLDVPPLPYALSVAADGERIGFTVGGDNSPTSLREIGVDGTGFRELLREGQDVPPVCCGTWTPNGKYFVFQGRHEGRADIWALPAERGFFRNSRAPVRLTHGPLSYSGLAPSRDGKQIFAVGSRRRGELVRYDANSQKFVPYLSGISAIDPVFSDDGKWIAYVSYPDHALWRSRLDGSERLQLTYSPTEAMYPAISPDGKKVAFATLKYDTYVVSMDGGSPENIPGCVAVAAWSPDGKSMVCTLLRQGKQLGDTDAFQLQILDVANRSFSVIPDSLNKLGSFWLTPDRLVAATQDSTKFLLFDFKAQKWTELFKGTFTNWFASPDKKYLYFTTGGTGEPKVVRLRFTDHKVETITSLKDFRRLEDPVQIGTQIGVAPDGSALFTRDAGTQEIYALNVRWP